MFIGHPIPSMASSRNIKTGLLKTRTIKSRAALFIVVQNSDASIDRSAIGTKQLLTHPTTWLKIRNSARTLFLARNKISYTDRGQIRNWK